MVIVYSCELVDASHSTRLPRSLVQRSTQGLETLSMVMFVTLQFARPMSNVTGKTDLPSALTAAGETAFAAVL